jgi:hypothetical protein
MKPRHANGYSDYKKLDVIARHRAQHDGYDSDGIPLCICTYPITGVPQLKLDEKPQDGEPKERK